jgi:hypothetical protein
VLPSRVPRPVRRPTAALLALVLAFAVGISAARAAPATVHEVPLPRGSRSLATDVFVSGQTFRKTVDHVARWLDKQGIAHEAVPVYRYRGVEVARFLSAQGSTAWLAIHVFRRQGKTMIAIVPRPPATPP